MNEENIVKLSRWGLGFGCLVLHAVTGVDSVILILAMVLLGVPVELVTKAKETTQNQDSAQESV